MSMNAMSKKDGREDDTVYLMKMRNSNIILKCGKDLGMILRRIGAYISIISDNRHTDGEYSQNMNSRVPREYALRKRNHSQLQKNTILLLIHQFEKLSIP